MGRWSPLFPARPRCLRLCCYLCVTSLGDSRSSRLDRRCPRCVRSPPSANTPLYRHDGTQSTMVDVSDTESTPIGPAEPTLAEVIARAEPIGDLSRFVIDDLTEEDEDEFFGILADL